MKAAKPKKPKLTKVEPASNVDQQACSFCAQSIFRVDFLWRSKLTKGVAICGECSIGIADLTVSCMNPEEGEME